MTIIDKKAVKKEIRFRARSRFCAICDSQHRWQCTCPNNKVMATQIKRSFHAGKRYKGKRALEYCYDTENQDAEL